MSSSITTSNGLVVVTQVFPQYPSDKTTLPEQNITSSIQTAQPSFQDKVSKMTAMFLRGGPQSLGIVQLFVGLLFMISSMTALLSPGLYVHAPLLTGITFVVSGSLAVGARNGTRRGLIKGVLAVHVVSVLAAVAGVAYLSYLLPAWTFSFMDLCGTDGDYGDYQRNTRSQRQCSSVVSQLNEVLYGVRGVLLVLCVLEVCVSVTVCVFSGKALHAKQDEHVVIKSGSTPFAGSLSASESDVPLLDEAAEEEVSGPPPQLL